MGQVCDFYLWYGRKAADAVQLLQVGAAATKHGRKIGQRLRAVVAIGERTGSGRAAVVFEVLRVAHSAATGRALPPRTGVSRRLLHRRLRGLCCSRNI